MPKLIPLCLLANGLFLSSTLLGYFLSRRFDAMLASGATYGLFVCGTAFGFSLAHCLIKPWRGSKLANGTNLSLTCLSFVGLNLFWICQWLPFVMPLC